MRGEEEHPRSISMLSLLPLAGLVSAISRATHTSELHPSHFCFSQLLVFLQSHLGVSHLIIIITSLSSFPFSIYQT